MLSGGLKRKSIRFNQQSQAKNREVDNSKQPDLQSVQKLCCLQTGIAKQVISDARH
jgi:hypothetical protein